MAQDSEEQPSNPADRALRFVVGITSLLKSILAEIRFPRLLVLLYRDVGFGILPVPFLGFLRVPSVYEREVTRTWKPRTGDTVVDIGSYMGKYSILSSRIASTIVAIEPHPDNFELLILNLRFTRSRRVKAVNAIITNHDGTDRLFESNHPSTHSVLPSEKARPIDLPCYTLDSLLESLGISCVDLIKIDVEGADLQVLTGMTKTMNRSGDLKMIIELDHDELGEIRDLKTLLELLGANGFQALPVGIDNHGHPRHLLALRAQTVQ